MEQKKYLVEFIGTTLFLLIILKSGNFKTIQPFVIVTGLLAAIFMGGAISGGHFNPAVSTMLHVSGTDPNVGSTQHLIGYVLAQVLGGIAAWNIHKATVSGPAM